MDRMLGPVQRALLAVLERNAQAGSPSEPDRWCTTSSLVTAIGRERTPSNSVVVSRALRSLVTRGLVEVRYPPIPRSGNGGRYALPRRPAPGPAPT